MVELKKNVEVNDVVKTVKGRGVPRPPPALGVFHPKSRGLLI